MRSTILFLFMFAVTPLHASADLPEGYRWHRADDLRGSFAVPSDWQVSDRAETPWQELSVTKPQPADARLAALTVRYAGDFEASLGITPSAYGKQRMDEELTRNRPLAASRGTAGGYAWFDFTVQVENEDDPNRIDAIRRIRVLADDAHDRVYVFAFEATPNEWIRTGPVREVLLRAEKLD